MAVKGKDSRGGNDDTDDLFLPLNDDEIAFCWRTLVDEGKLSMTKLQEFMKELCGIELSPVQAKDVLNYMDANSDGRVGMEDFKYFMSVGRLRDTDVKTFMWSPKAKFHAEHGKAEVKDRVDDLDGGTDSSIGVQATAKLFQSKPPEGRPAGFRRKHGSKEDSLKKDGIGVATSPAAMAKIDAALGKYEQQCWDKFLGQEEEFLRELFEQFASPGGSDEMTVLEYHKMLVKWCSLNPTATPGDLRPGDSLAALQYILRREKEGKVQKETRSGDGPERAAPKRSQKQSESPHEKGTGVGGEAAPSTNQQGGGRGQRAGGTGGGGGTSALAQAAPTSSAAELEPVMTYKLWRDVLAGKFQPDEHITPMSSSSR